MVRTRKILLILFIVPLYAYAETYNEKVTDITETTGVNEQVSGQEKENSLGALLQKIRTSLALYTIKIRDNWNTRYAAVTGASCILGVFLTLYMRLNKNKKIDVPYRPANNGDRKATAPVQQPNNGAGRRSLDPLKPPRCKNTPPPSFPGSGF